MCDECKNIAAEHIMDYVLLGLHIQVAIRLECEAVMHRALLDRVGQDAIDTALGLRATVVEVGEGLAVLAAKEPDAWAMLLDLRKMEQAQGGRDMMGENDGENDGVDWAEVAWIDRELSGDVTCCDSRDHSNGTDDDVQCLCPNHPRSYLHPRGDQEWPAP